MSTVSIARCEQYSQDEVSSALDAALSPLGGMAAFVSAGQSVLLKVNLLAKAAPERAVTTHPEVVRALIRSVRTCGAVPFVGDSPGGPNTPAMVRRVWDESGIGEVCAEEGVDLVLFDDDCVRVDNPAGALYGAFTLGRAVTDADVVITVPKLKTHGFMMFTGAVKNLFGCIPGLEKARFHLTVPDRDDFGSMLVDLMLACKPTLAVMDAVVGMEGEGPAGGTPRHIGAILVSADPVSLDVIASAITGLDPLEVYSNKAAARRGLGPTSADEVEVVGTPWRELAPLDFSLPARDPFARMPSWVGRALRSTATARPYLADEPGCTRCKTCQVNCPVDAITVGSDGPAFDYSTCIRCYCCQELCPPQVIGLKVPRLARLLQPRSPGRSRS